MMAFNLDTLPEPLILDICTHLEIFELVSLSEVNQALRYLAKTRPSFWLPTLSRCGLFLPLPTHRPLRSYSASDLYIAAHRACLTQANLTSPFVRLRSYNHITWPYIPSAGIADLKDESAEEAIHMHLSHPNGEWLFTVSSGNVLRILHLRTGQLAMVYGLDKFATGSMFPPPTIAWAVEFREEEEATMVMNCHLAMGDEWSPGIRVFNILFHPERAIAEMSPIGAKALPGMPTHLDLAGGYIVAVSSRYPNPLEAGDICTIRYPELTDVKLPPLYPSIRIAAFQDYFISLGLSPSNQLVAQIVGLPSRRLTEERLAVHSYPLSYSGPLIDRGYPLYGQICHFYTCSPSSVVYVWIRAGTSGSWRVYAIPFDVAELQSSASRVNTGKALEGEELMKTFDKREEGWRVLEERELRHWCSPAAGGRRYLWYRMGQGYFPAMPTEGYGQGQRRPEAEEEDAFRLYVSSIDDLLPVEEMSAKELDRSFRLDVSRPGIYGTGEPGDDFAATVMAQFNAARKQLAAVRRLEVPKELAERDRRVYMFVMEEWSGCVIVQMWEGDLWVLRYGKA